MKYILKKSDIEQETEEYFKAIAQSTNNSFSNMIYTSSLEINDYIKITKNYNDCYKFNLDLPIEEKFLLSFGNPERLDGAYFDVECLIWNEIITDDDNIQQYNRYTVQQENIFDLYYEIEQEILKNDLTITKNDFTIDLLSLIDIDLFINEYFTFKDDVDIEYLKELIKQGIMGLDTWISNNIKEYFESEKYYDLINEIEFYEIDYINSEINQNGYFEVYI